MRKKTQEYTRISASQKTKNEVTIPEGTTVTFPDGRQFVLKSKARIVRYGS